METTDDLNELFIVVDRDDNFVGYRTRGECHDDIALTHRSVSVVLFDNKGRVLLQERSMTKDKWPGHFTVSASGHVTKGFLYEETAHKEMKEEIGVKTPLKFVTKFFVQEPWESEIVSVFTGVHEGPFHINKHEVKDVAYYAPHEIHKIHRKLTSSAKRTLEIVGILH